MDATILRPARQPARFRLEWRSLVELVRSRAETEGQRKLYTFLAEGAAPERSLSYAELDRRARAIGACLQDSSAAGQRVLLLFPPGLDYIAAFFGCLYANAIAVPAYPPRQNRNLDRLRKVVYDARPAIALTTQTVMTEIESSLGEYPDLKALKWIAADRLASQWSREWRDLNPDPGTLAFLQYTSGSTGNPKGVMVSHANLLHNEALIQRAFGQSSSSIIVGWLPLFHDMGLIGNVIQPLYAAAECVLFSPMSFLQRPFRWLEAISRYRATTSGGPNFAYDLCVRKIKPEERQTLDLSSWAVAFNGAEPVRQDTFDRFCAAFEPCGFRREAFFPCYGLAEATLFVSGGPGNRKPVVRDFERAALDQHRVVSATSDERDVRSLVGCGYAPEHLVVIADPESHAVCKRGHVGEVWVSSQSVAQGYWNQTEESDRIFRAHLDTGDGPYLRTGDLGFMDGGQLYITGRLKDLIIIRGRNCYPEDIEHTLGHCHRALRPGEGVVFSAELEGEERLIVVHEVARDYRGNDLPKVVESMRSRVAEEHDLQLFHVALIQTGTLLRTSSGKIRRQAMKKVFLEGKIRALYQWQHSQQQEIETVAPAALDLEAACEWIAAKVATVVGATRDEIDRNKPIVQYGMDSLACMELAHSLEASLGAALPVTLLSDLSISEIAQRVVDQCGRPDDRSTVEPAVISPEIAFPLSEGQAALWFLHGLAPQSAAYNVMGGARLRGEVDVAGLKKAFQTLLDRHLILRARFESRGGRPVQVIQENVTLFFHEEDLSALPETDLRARVAAEARRPFDLENGPLIRLALFTTAGGDRLLMLVAHHIVIDMWSVAVLVNELKSIYEAAACGGAVTLPPLEFSYRDFVISQQQELAGPGGQQLQQYWQKELSGELPILNLNTDYPRPYLQTFAGASESIRLDNQTVNRLQELARSNVLSIHSLLLAAYAVLLYRHTNQSEVIVGCPVSGRNDRRFQSLVGYFVNPVPVRIRLNERMTFRQLLAEVRETVQRALTHQAYPFARIVEDVCADRDLSRSPVFQSTFVFEQPPLFIDRSLSAFVLGEEQAQLTLGPLTLESIKIDQAIAQFDLSMLVAPFAEDLLVALQYNTSLFKSSTIKNMLGHFRVLLDEITAHPDQRILDLPMLAREEQRQLLDEFNDTRSDYTRHDSVPQLFEAQVKKTPRAVAVRDENSAISYRELNAKANRLAHHLRASGVGPDSRVAILLPRTLEMIAAMLAVLKAGGAYVPLDPAYPADRLSFMLEDSEASVVICQDTLAHHFTEQRAKIINLDTDQYSITRQSRKNPRPCVKPENLSHLIYTSGSTGRPKGVAIEHGNVIHFLHWAHQTFTPAELSGVLAATSICFDLSVFEIFAPLTCGGTIILANDALHLATHSAAASVTLINTVPSAMTGLLRLGAVGPKVLTVNLAGEALKNSLVQQIYAETNVCRVLNLYGPTEYTTYTTGVEVERGSASEPTIGKPIANTRVYILNKNGGPVPVGVVGEICIGGEGLARCYLNRPEMTAERFIPDHLSLAAGSRLYRTGDVGRYLENGEIEYLGRLDHQIKLRGYRIELGEIESALLRFPGIREAVVVAKEDLAGEKQLVAYLLLDEMDQHAGNDELRNYLRQTLPGFMVPQFFVTLAKMPLTSNGKVDRLSLPDPQEISLPQCVKPVGPIEEVVASIWAEVLGLEHVGTTTNFFDIGGQSLKAVQVVARLAELLRVELPVTTLFEAPTVQALASVVERALAPAGRTAVAPIERVSRGSSLPLSFAQQRLWFLQRLEPSSVAYNISFSARFVGPVNLAAIGQSINEIVRRHESLRTTFAEVDSVPVQVIAPALTVLPVIIDVSGRNESERQTEWQRLLREEARRPFDLENGPLIRATILRLSENECVVSLSLHHAISDGWSGGVFIRELMSIYEAFTNGSSSPLPPLAVQYADFAHWQRQQLQQDDFQAQLSYWRKQLSEAPQLELPVRTRPAVRTEQGSVIRFNLPAELVQKLRALSRRNGATLFMTLLATLQVLLSRYSSQTDIAVGTPVANRTSAEIEPLIGCFVNTLVMRTDLSGDPSFRELLERVREVALGGYTHSAIPFERLVSELQPDRDLSRTPLFQVMMVLQNTPQQPLVLGDLHCRIEEVDNGTAKFELLVQLTEREESLDGKWEYSTDLFEAGMMERMVTHFRTLLESVVENENRHLSELSILTDQEQLQLRRFNETQQEVAPDAYLHQSFEAQVEKTPDAIALVHETGNLTYQELNRRANRLAHYLQTQSVGPETRVALLLKRSPELIVSMLAVLKAGGAYLPLDPAYPAERLSFMLEDAGASVLICRDEHKFPKHNVRVVDLDLESPLIDEQSSDNPVSGVEPGNLSHVIYTSGSTGRPKGVAIEHRSVISFLQWARNTFSKAELGGVCASTSICFDLSVFEIFAPLSCGGAVVLADDALHLAMHTAADRVTLINTVPSAMVELLRLQAVGAGVLSVNLAGETLRRSLVQDIYLQTRVELVRNLYGPTEYTTYATAEDVEREDDGEPAIGRPIANTQIYILDQALALTPPGVAGEIFIGGHGLARGYLNRPDLTADRFLPDSFSGKTGSRLYRTGDLGKYLDDGRIEYLGRKDHQVKVRGYRIELGEIETALEQHESIREAVVVARGEAEDQRLVAYVLSERESIDPESYEAELRRCLRERLPGYMAPSIFVFLDRLPLTANGKVDRNALPAPERLSQRKKGFVAGRTVTEQLLVQIWSEVLKIEPIGIHDDFFEIGGHSLLATQVVSRIRATFQIELPLRSLFEKPTIESLAQAIESQTETVISEPIERVSRQTALPLSFAQQRLWFLGQLDPNNSAYNLSMVLRLDGQLNIPALAESLNEIVQRHEVLRTRFVAEDGPPRQVIQPGAGANLVTIDLSGLPPGIREREAQSLNVREAQRPFNLSDSRLLRLVLLKLDDDKHWLLLVAHHIIADGWSVGIFTRELTQLYRAFSHGEDSPLPECPIQYADFAAWQRNWLTGQRLADELSYWKEQLSDAPALLELPTDHPRPAVQTFRGADVSFSLPSALTNDLKALCRTHAVTPFMTLLAAFAMLLSRYSRQPDVCIGTPLAGRTRLETEDLIGLFVNTLVLRTRFTNELTIRDLLAQVREVTLQAHAHQHLPFEKLVDELQPERTLSYSPLFQAMFVLQNAPAEELDIHGLSLSRIDAETETAQFDLNLRIDERAGEFTGRLNYNADLFERATIERMTRHFQQLLGEMVRDPEQLVTGVKMLSGVERERLIVEWNRRDQQYEAAGGLMARFERAVQRNAEAIALQDGAEQVSYCELNRRANQLGHYLRRHHVGPEVRVGLLLDRSVEMIVSILGVLKAGGAYVPMELSAPADRIAYMLEDSGCTLLLTEKKQVDVIDEKTARSTKILALDELSEEIAAEPENNPGVPVSADNMAYMIYTSGSTGKPKGVMVTHANVLRLLDATDRWYGFGSGDVWTMFHSYAFDVSVWELWGSLLYGGRLVVVPYWVSRTPEAYYELLQREQVTVLNQTPSAFRQVQPLLEQGSAGQLRLVIFAGEALELNSLASWYEQFGDEGPQLVNMYGITETTVHSTYRPLRQMDVIEARGSLVGRRIPDLEIYLLDERQEPVPVGVPGELYVGGAGVARGYLNRPELTAERFIAHPFSTTGGERLYRSGDLARYLGDGDIEYLGRIDHQVKIRGYRIETGEIESVLASYPGVRKAVVIPKEFETGHKYLAAYVTGDGGPGTDGLRNYLEAKLPAYMVPSALMWVDSIKLTTNGKVDRRSLPEPARDSDDKAYVPASSPTEKLLASIWQDILKVERVGVNDNFFELGGDSILTTHVVTAARRAGLHLTPQQLFQQQTIGKLALIAEQALPAITQQSSQLPKEGDPELRWTSLGDDEINSLKSWTDLSNIEDSYPLTSFQQGILFHILDRPASGIYLNQQSYTLQGKLDVPAFQNAFKAVVNRHQILRTAFILSGQNGPLQMVFRQVDAPWAMYDWRGIPAAEADEHLAVLQQAEYRIGFELSRAPLMRMTLVQRETDLYEFIWSYHLLLLDGVSGVVVFKELLEFYEAFQTGRPVELEPPARYGDYVDWLQKQEQREAEAYWRQTLAQFTSPTALGFDRAETTSGLEQKDYREQVLLLDQALTKELRSLAARSHLTLNTLVQGAWALLLSRRSGSNDVVFGSTVSGRLAEFPESESTVGLFVNVLPMRVRVPREVTLKTWLSEIQSQQAEARRFEFCALPDIQGWSEVPRGQPLFESVLILQNIPLEFSLSESVGLQILAIKSTERTNVPLAVIIEPGSQLRFKIVYQRTRFNDVTIDRMIRNLQRTLNWMTTNSAATLSSFPTFFDDERNVLIESFNQSL